MRARCTNGGPVVAAVDVVLARPHHLHRLPARLGHVHRLGDEVRGGVGPPAEAAAEEHGVDLDLLGLEAGDLGREPAGRSSGTGCPTQISHLSAREPDGAVGRLHHRVRQVGHVVLGLDGLGRLARAPAAVSPALAAGIPRVRPAAGTRSGAASLSSSAPGPRSHSTASASRPELGRPEVVGHHGDAGRHLHHVAHARHRLGLGARRTT